MKLSTFNNIWYKNQMLLFFRMHVSALMIYYGIPWSRPYTDEIGRGQDSQDSFLLSN